MLIKALSHPRQTAALLARDPSEAFHKVVDRLAQRAEPAVPVDLYRADPNWEQRVHGLLGAPFPCGGADGFHALWPCVLDGLRQRGIEPGPLSFYGWNDADPEFARAIWCAVRHCRASGKGLRVLETGVAHGVSTRIILEALPQGETHHLWSIDVPPHDPAMRPRVGIAVEERLRSRWTYVEGSSRRRLPALLRELGTIDLFVHDSIHTRRNVTFELEQAWPALRPGGCALVDDIDSNWGFHAFAQLPGRAAVICQSEPIRADPRRADRRGLFGFIRKDGGDAA
jgi:hypothetical protein